VRLLLGKGETNIEDDALVQQIISGQDDCFRLLIERHRRYLYQVVYSIVNHDKDAEDVTQEAFVQIYFALPQYKFQGFKTWMTRIAVNRAIDYKRKARQRKENLYDDFPDHPPPNPALVQQIEQSVMREERRSLVHKCLAEMPGNYHEVVIAYYIEEKTYQQIATEQGIELKTVESKLYRAKKWLRKHWKEEDFR
jgi:RNA polymerase sigma factor (sigma-70 family)